MPALIPEGFSCLKLHTGPVSPSGDCVPCRREKEHRYRAKGNPAQRAKVARHQRSRIAKLKVATFEAYGGASCACCGESTFEFLTLDHVNDDGAEHRRQIGSQGGWTFYKYLSDQGFPEPERYQVLCWNCNCAKQYHGTCPHQTTRIAVA